LNLKCRAGSRIEFGNLEAVQGVHPAPSNTAMPKAQHEAAPQYQVQG
jgi:hypothetical protein